MNGDPAIDLRSDTLTRPDAAMRRAMAEAEVGDDVYGEDPTVRRLEEEGAAAVGQEAALFVPSGTMGNQIGLRLLAPRGTEVLCDARAHLMFYENAGLAALSGLQTRPVESPDGLPPVAALDAAFTPRGGFRVPTGALAVENTHNMAGGRAFGPDRLDPVLAFARRAAIPAHLDGARIFNTSVALGVPVPRLVEGFASVMFCLSKGLGAPVGSLLAGSRELVAEAVEVRRLFGGAMRQVGVLAAAGLVALRQGPKLLADDHRRARRLAEALQELPGVGVDPTAVETNILMFRVAGSPDEWVARAGRAGVLGSPYGRHEVRFVTYRDLDERAIETAISRLRAEFS
jgi:threonine aldolase